MIAPVFPSLTPMQYGAVVPTETSWPINGGRTGQYNIAEIYATVQGEGRLAGTPMTIIRLRGCPVGCVFCDQPETWDPTKGLLLLSSEIAARVERLSPRWALITGGEPTWHDLQTLTCDLQNRGLKTALETSGVFPITGRWDWICWSPKPAGRLPMLLQYFRYANEIKWLVGRDRDVTALEEFLAQPTSRRSGQHIVIQPISCSLKATQVCLDALGKHPEWFLSIQTHKYIGVP